MVDFVLKILFGLGTLTNVSATRCEPDSETLTSDSQLARGIQSKSIWGLGMDFPLAGVGGEAPHELGG